ncbi:MAG: hypothetical protein JJU36_13150 [Phycisphaeraceae bacterium]|nr:hypothetical protein [Phycisphaeraceae bacterium]
MNHTRSFKPDAVESPGSRRTSPGHRRRGTVMFEILLVLPFILLIVAVLLYLGHATLRMQRAKIMDRYEAWHVADHAHGPSSESGPGNEHINAMFQLGTAVSINRDQAGGHLRLALRMLQDHGSNINPDLGRMIGEYHDAFPGNVTVGFSTHHDHSGGGVLANFDGPISHDHARIGNDWKFVNSFRRSSGEWVHSGSGPWNLSRIQEVFYDDLDQAFQSLAHQTIMAPHLRAWYRYRPGYQGPHVGN